MAKAAQRVRDDAAGPGVRSPKHVGRQLRHVRRKQGLSRAEVARSAGLTRRELAVYERGRVEIPDSDLWCLAGSCGVDVAELLPQRDELRIDSELSSLAIGDSIRHLREPAEPDSLLREYLAMIYELRNLPPGSAIPLRESDLSTLADALGGTPEAIESRLVELVGVNRHEAARLRAMIAPPLALDAGEVHSIPSPIPAPDAGAAELYGAAIQTEATPLLDAFLDTPRAEDPFSDPPPLAPAEHELGTFDAMPPSAPLDPLAGLPLDPFATATPDPAPMAIDGASPMSDPAAWAPDPPAPDESIVGAFSTLRPDPFAPAGALADAPELRLPDPDPHGIVIDLPDPGPQPSVEELSPIIPDHDLWATRETPPFADAPAVGYLEDRTALGAVESFSETAVEPPMPVAAAPVFDAPVAVAPVPDAPVAPIAWHAATEMATEQVTDDASPPRTDEPVIGVKHAGSGWQVGGMFPATAMADDGALSLQRADTRWALSDLVAPGDVTAEAIVDFTAGAGFGIVFRAGLDPSGALYGYSFDIDAVPGGGGAYVVRQWEGNRPHWRPLAHAQVLDPTRLLGRRTITLCLQGDSLTVHVDGESVLTLPSLSRASIELARQPCRGDRLGIQAAATAEATVSRLSATQH